MRGKSANIFKIYKMNEVLETDLPNAMQIAKEDRYWQKVIPKNIPILHINGIYDLDM